MCSPIVPVLRAKKYPEFYYHCFNLKKKIPLFQIPFLQQHQIYLFLYFACITGKKPTTAFLVTTANSIFG